MSQAARRDLRHRLRSNAETTIAPVFSVETVMQRIGILFSVVAVFLISCVQAQKRTGNADAQQPSAAHSHFPKVTIATSELRTIKSTSTGRDYDLYIHIPKQYDKDQTAKYPVLYLLDAQWEFKLVEQVVGGLVFDQYMPDVIIVGITYSGENADYDGLRAMDLTPTPTEGIKGSGDDEKLRGNDNYIPKPISCKAKTANDDKDVRYLIAGLVADPYQHCGKFDKADEAMKYWDEFRTAHLAQDYAETGM